MRETGEGAASGSVLVEEGVAKRRPALSVRRQFVAHMRSRAPRALATTKTARTAAVAAGVAGVRGGQGHEEHPNHLQTVHQARAVQRRAAGHVRLVDELASGGELQQGSREVGEAFFRRPREQGAAVAAVAVVQEGVDLGEGARWGREFRRRPASEARGGCMEGGT